MAEGEYQYRAKYKHAGGSYSEYSPIESGVISLAVVLNFITSPVWTGSGTAVLTSSPSIGAAYATRRLFLFGTIADPGGTTTMSSVTFNGVTAPVLVQASWQRWRICGPWASAIVATGTAVTIAMNYSGGVFNIGSTCLYQIDNTLITSPTPVDTQHTKTTPGVTTASVSVNTQLNGFSVLMGRLWSGTNTALNVTSSTDTMIQDTLGAAFTNKHALNTLTRSTTITAGWANNDSDCYLYGLGVFGDGICNGA